MMTEDQSPQRSGSQPSESGLLRRTGTAVLGLSVVLVGIPLIPLFGPGWLIVFTGLAILAREFVWARRLRDRLRDQLERFRRRGADQ